VLQSKKQKKHKFNSPLPSSSLLCVRGIEASEDNKLPPDTMNLSLDFTTVLSSWLCFSKEKQYLHLTHNCKEEMFLGLFLGEMMLGES